MDRAGGEVLAPVGFGPMIWTNLSRQQIRNDFEKGAAQ